MTENRLLWLIPLALILAGLVFAYRAYATPTEATVLVEWSTASELDTAGFNVYRSDTPDGPFRRVNEQLIPAAPDPLIGGSYVYTDTNVIAGQTYYYELEDVETGGTTTRHGPITVKAEADTKPGLLMGAGLIAIALIGMAIVVLRKRQRG